MSYRDNWKLEDYENEVRREKRWKREAELELRKAEAELELKKLEVERCEESIVDYDEDIAEAITKREAFKAKNVATEEETD